MVKPGTAGLVTLCVAAAAFKCWLNELCVKYARRNESYRCKTGLVKPDTLCSARAQLERPKTAFKPSGHSIAAGNNILAAHAERLRAATTGQAQG